MFQAVREDGIDYIRLFCDHCWCRLDGIRISRDTGMSKEQSEEYLFTGAPAYGDRIDPVARTVVCRHCQND